MIDFQSLLFNQKLSQARIQKAVSFFGEKIISRILAFALFLLGIKKITISEMLHIPFYTLKSFFRILFVDGISALIDRRRKSPQTSTAGLLPSSLKVSFENKFIELPLNTSHEIIIPKENKMQFKTLVLTLYNNNLLKLRDAAQLLNYSKSHIISIAQKLKQQDIHALIDKRQGQTMDYVVTSEIKAELIKEYTYACITKKSTSGRAITSQLIKKHDIKISERTVRNHINKLGLPTIKKQLKEMVDALKKTH